jgi:hypothetical protein
VAYSFQVFQSQICMILSPPMCAICLTHLILLHLNILLFCEELMFYHKKTENTATAQKLKQRQIVFLVRLWSNKVSFLRTTGDVVWQFKICGLFTPNFIFRLWIFWRVAWLKVGSWSPIAEVWVWSCAISCGICGRTEWQWDILFSEYFNFPLSVSFH